MTAEVAEAAVHSRNCCHDLGAGEGAADAVRPPPSPPTIVIGRLDRPTHAVSSQRGERRDRLQLPLRGAGAAHVAVSSPFSSMRRTESAAIAHRVSQPSDVMAGAPLARRLDRRVVAAIYGKPTGWRTGKNIDGFLFADVMHNPTLL